MRSRTATWFECKIRYEKTMEDGMQKKVTEAYVVDALSFSEAEERIIEEMRTGRTLDGALDRGTKSSLTAIIDGNMTIVIVALILLLVFGPFNVLSFIFGQSTTGTIYSFGYTLLMGVISNFIMGVGLSRVMLRAVAGYKWARHKWLFGGAKDGK